MARTLQDVLNNELSADNLGDKTPNEVANYLIEIGVLESAADFSRLAIEKLQEAVFDGDEFPIHYYSKEEPFREESRYPDPGLNLTDEYTGYKGQLSFSCRKNISNYSTAEKGIV